jgi:diguanylate cyclase (GGDEF)-like protein
MLLSKERTMCQDVTPNTAEGKNMMYAITWNEAGDKMVQVGVEPLRLMDTLQNNEITAVMDNIPTYEGIDIMVAEVDTGTICGSTNGNMLDKNLSDIGIDKDSDDLRLMTGVRLIVDGNACYCSVRKKGDYIVVVADAVSNGVKNLAIGFAIEFVYLLIAGITLCSMFKKMVRSNDEKEEMFYKANADQLTGLYNRRAYEDYITECNDTPPEDNFVFVSMDVNGLKPVNDNLGHAAGDELLTGAAGCMKHCMGQYGNIYRTGGDEFIAIIFANDRQLHDIKRNFKAATTRWSGKHVKTLSVSCGFVAKRELVGKVSIHEMADIADKRMYEAKERFYKKHPGYERRVAR